MPGAVSNEERNADIRGPYACMTRPTVTSGAFSLSAVEPEHIEAIRQWRNAQLDVLRQSVEIGPDDQIAYYRKHVWPDKTSKTPAQILLIYCQGARPIGYGGLVHISWEHKYAEVSFLLDPELEREPITRADLFLTFLGLLQTVAFGDLRFDWIFTETYSKRIRHIETLEKAGFVRDGRLRDQLGTAETPSHSIFHKCAAADIEPGGRTG